MNHHSSPAQQKYVYIFPHLSKTGGQTLRNHFTKHLKLHEEFIHLGPWGFRQEKLLKIAPFHDRSLAMRNKAKVILGHQVKWETQHLIPDKKARHIIFLRDPAERLVSCYNFQTKTFPEYKKHSPSFSTWYSTINKNSICHWIIRKFMEESSSTNEFQKLNNEEVFQKANDILENFWLVGLTEKLDTLAPYFLKKINLPIHMERFNITGVHFAKTIDCTENIRKQIYADHPADLKLVQTWGNKLKSRIQELQDQS